MLIKKIINISKMFSLLLYTLSHFFPSHTTIVLLSLLLSTYNIKIVITSKISIKLTYTENPYKHGF